MKKLILSLLVMTGLMLMVSGVSATITEIEITSPAVGEFWGGTQNIEWTAVGEEGDFVDIFLYNGGQEVIKLYREYNGVPYPLDTMSHDDGDSYYIFIRASNPSNWGTNDVSNLFTIDNTDPIVTINSVTTPTKVDTQTITGTFTELNLDKIEVNGIIAYIDGTTYSATIDLEEGPNTITIVATDLAGNTGQVSDTIVLDTTAPTVTVDGAVADLLVGSNVQASVICLDDDCDETSYMMKKVIEGESCPQEYNQYNLISPYTVDSHAYICAAAKDDIGNVGFSTPVEFKVFATIQEAIDAANPSGGDTINVAAGTYDEQVVIDKSLTLQGVGDTTVIQPSGPELTATTSIPWIGTTHTMSAIVSVETAGDEVTIKNLKIDGSLITSKSTTWQGGLVYLETGGIIDSVTVNGGSTLPDRTAGIFAAAITNPVSLEVTGCTVEVYTRAGIYALGGTITADYHHNAINGPGDSLVGVPNGMFFLEGAKGSATYNTVTDLGYTGETWRSTGIGTYNAGTGIVFSHNEISLVQNAFALAKNTVGTTVEYNDVHDCHTGVKFESGATNSIIQYNEIYDNDFAIRGGGTMGDGNVVHYNNFVGNDGTEWIWDGETYIGAVSNVHDTYVLNAEINYWGCPKGPENSACDSVSDNVDYTPWAWNEDMEVDEIEPVTTDSGTDSNWHNSDVTVTLVCNDADSSCDETYYCTDQEGICNPETLGNSIIVGAEGENYVRFYSVDFAGNVELVKTAENTVKIDNTDPIVTIDSVTTPTKIDTQTIMGTFTELNLDKIEVNGELAIISGNSYSAEVLLSEGSNDIIVVATDLAGNTGQVSDTIVLDTTAPEITDVTGDTAILVGESINVCATVTDSGSGVNNVILHYDLVNVLMDYSSGDEYCQTIPILEEDKEYWITATDKVGLATTSLPYTIEVFDYMIGLETGWNLLSIPLVPEDDDTSIESVLSGVSGNVKIVWSYQQGEWSYYSGENGGNLDRIIPGFGYYIKMNGEDTLYQNGEKMYGNDEFVVPRPPVVTLTPSWNLIGHYGMVESLPKEDALDTLAGSYSTMLDKEGNPISYFNPTEGYWLFLTGTDNLDYAPSEEAYTF